MLHEGGAVRSGADLPDDRLPDELTAAVREWREVAETVLQAGDPHELDLLRRRGRQLAGRVAAALGRPVTFVDPVSGAAESVRGESVRAESVRGESVRAEDAPPVPAAPTPRPGLALEPPGPTPWGTGLAVAVFVAVLAAIADVVLARAFAGAFGLLWVPANLLVTAGTAPSLWLAREVPFWRWPAAGAAVGLGAGWVVMLVELLGS